ncbi:Predicted DNA-binding transcriptional regulator YafY, contains an HTH and WYL domains [Pedobacter westerhofensis]|uniref:Predicted DNA-binding transcriptional regulator YafY, contains an HTH and WYL domains n=1 Tax=Pedobacter westerhofensis TaxID=425512 RepID=A0A521FRS7_9SPHI|nr:YafY family protein [Pedobacter westerhofensis]SMO98908.1 Predicted DNA-binding transcriptional regulator YafY, contains an HTH and WYL domains [Pedobacter westerhofensis]
MNRLDRLSAILIQLQSRRTVRAQDIADRFDISLRTVYRDIRSLEQGGIPIIGEAGIGYSIMEGYRLPPVMFSREEATAFITAEKLVTNLTDAKNGNSYSLALDKIRAVLKTSDKDYLENIDHRIEVVTNNRGPEISLQQNRLQIILNAIAEKKLMRLDYFAYYRQEHTQRMIEPAGVFYLENHWHLIAWCRLRKRYRDFRFDRIRDISITEEHYDDVHPSIKQYLSEQFKDMKLHDVTILVDKEASLHLGEQKYYQGYVSEKESDKGIEMQFLSTHLEGFARWYMSFADYAVILKPEALQQRVKSLFAAISKNINSY